MLNPVFREGSESKQLGHAGPVGVTPWRRKRSATQAMLSGLDISSAHPSRIDSTSASVSMCATRSPRPDRPGCARPRRHRTASTNRLRVPARALRRAPRCPPPSSARSGCLSRRTSRCRIRAPRTVAVARRRCRTARCPSSSRRDSAHRAHSSAPPPGADRTRPENAARSQAGRVTVLARMPSVARSAPSEITGKMPASLQVRVDLGPVVVGGDAGRVPLRLEPVAVDVPELWSDLTEDRPGDLAVGYVFGDGDRHVVLPKRVVVQRLAVHVDDEGVPTAARPGRRSNP